MKKLIIVAVVGFLAYWVYENKWSYSDSSLKAQAAMLSKGLPMKMGPEFTVIAIEALPGKKVAYTAKGFMPSKYLPADAADRLKSAQVRQPVAAELCKQKPVLEALKHGVTLIYAFQSQDGIPITEISFTVADCN